MAEGPRENTERNDLKPIVPTDFEVPLSLTTDHTVLRPLGPEHNQSDYEAWTSSIEHIRATPGFGPPRRWPIAELTLDENLRDCEIHRKHFDERVGFTYTILDRLDEQHVLGCVYIYEDQTGEQDVEVRSWVRSDRAELDHEVWSAVSDWLGSVWPFDQVKYSRRQRLFD